MKLSSFFQKTRVIASGILLVGAAMVCFSIWHVPAVKSDQNDLQQYYGRLRDGVGSEVAIASPGAAMPSVRGSIDSLSDFMQYRSGVALSEPVKNRLADLEAGVLAGTRRRLTQDALKEILAETAMERLASLTPQQIASAVETWRGFSHPQLPEGFQRGRDYVALRASRVDTITPEDLTDYLTKIKESDSTSSKIYRSAALNLAEKEIASRTARRARVLLSWRVSKLVY